MELKTARLTLLIDPNKKAAFEHLCARQDRTASQVVRQLIRDYLTAYNVSYVASGAELRDAKAAKHGAVAHTAKPAKAKRGPKSKADQSRHRR